MLTEEHYCPLTGDAPTATSPRGVCENCDRESTFIFDGHCEHCLSHTDCSAIRRLCRGHGRQLAPACCERAGEYNGYGSDGPWLFHCPLGCSCHD